MASPAKRRKIDNGTKSSPVASRSLDYFFGKQKRDIPSGVANGVEHADDRVPETSVLADEQLARKLQAEWDQEAATLSVEAASNGEGPSRPTHTVVDGQTLPPIGRGALCTGEAIHNTEDFPEMEHPVEGKSQAEPKTMPLMSARSKNTLSLQSTESAEDMISSTIPFDESPLTFDPQKYVYNLQKHWAAEGKDASYAILTRCFVLVNNTQSRIKIVDTLVNFLRIIIEGDPSSLLPTVRLD